MLYFQLKEENDTISLRIQEQHKHREVLQRGLAEMKNEISQRNATNVSTFYILVWVGCSAESHTSVIMIMYKLLNFRSTLK